MLVETELKVLGSKVSEVDAPVRPALKLPPRFGVSAWARALELTPDPIASAAAPDSSSRRFIRAALKISMPASPRRLAAAFERLNTIIWSLATDPAAPCPGNRLGGIVAERSMSRLGTQRVGALETLRVAAIQGNLQRGDGLIDMLRPGRADDGGRLRLLAQDPGQRELAGRDLPRLRDLVQRLGQSRVLGPTEPLIGIVVRPRALGRALPAPIGAAQEPARHRAIGQQADALGLAERDHLALVLAPEQIVVMLHRRERAEAAQSGRVDGLGELPARHVGRADVEHLAPAHQMIERADHLVDIGRRIPDVGLVEIDVVGAEPLQRGLAGLDDVLSRIAAGVGVL